MEVQRLHTVLHGFLHEGQLAIETFPPLSFLVSATILPQQWTAIQFCNLIATTLLLGSHTFALSLSPTVVQTLWTMGSCGVPELMMVVPVLLGCNWTEAILGLALLLVKRLYLGFSSLRIPSSSVVCLKSSSYDSSSHCPPANDIKPLGATRFDCRFRSPHHYDNYLQHRVSLVRDNDWGQLQLTLSASQLPQRA